MPDDPAPIDTDSIASKILAALRRTPAPDDDLDYDDEGRKPIPRYRWNKLLAENKELREWRTEVQSQLEALKTGYDAKVTALQEEVAGQVKTIGQRHQEDLRLVDLGVRDDLGRQTVRSAYEQAPKDTRGKSAADWWEAQVTALTEHRADPKTKPAPTIPTALLGYLPPPGGKPGATQPATPPPSNRTAAAPSLDDIPVGVGPDEFIARLKAMER